MQMCIARKMTVARTAYKEGVLCGNGLIVPDSVCLWFVVG